MACSLVQDSQSAIPRTPVRGAVYLLTLALCIPTRLFALQMPGHHQFLVPVMTIVVLFAWVIFLRGRLPAVSGNLSLIWFFLVLFGALVFMASWDNPLHQASLMLYGVYLVRIAMFFVLTQVLVGDEHLQAGVERILTGALAILAFMMVSGLLDRIGSYLRASAVAHGVVMRADAGLGDPNFTAFAFNIGLALALVWFATAETLRQRTLSGIACLLLVAGIGRTVSIGGLIGLMVILVLAGWWMIPRAGSRASRLMFVIIGLLCVIAAVGGGLYLARVEQQVSQAEHSIGALGSERLNLTLGGLRMAWVHPLLGVGPANVSRSMPPNLLFPISSPDQGPHDGFVAVADESGIPSSLAWVLSIGLIFWLGWKAERRLRCGEDRKRYLRHVGLWIAGLSCAVQTLALGTQRDPFLWFLLALLLASAWRNLLIRQPGERIA